MRNTRIAFSAVMVVALTALIIYADSLSKEYTDPKESFNAIIALLRVVSPFFALAMTWIVGYEIINYWNLARKRSESDIELEKEFQLLIGEFKTIWRKWKFHMDKHEAKQNGLIRTNNDFEERERLFYKATEADGRIEAVLLHICSNRRLSDFECFKLGVFRQIFQRLREGLRDRKSLKDGYYSPIYRSFHEVYSLILIILKRKTDKLSAEESYRQYTKVLAVRKAVLRMPGFRSEAKTLDGLNYSQMMTDYRKRVARKKQKAQRKEEARLKLEALKSQETH